MTVWACLEHILKLFGKATVVGKVISELNWKLSRMFLVTPTQNVSGGPNLCPGQNGWDKLELVSSVFAEKWIGLLTLPETTQTARSPGMLPAYHTSQLSHYSGIPLTLSPVLGPLIALHQPLTGTESTQTVEIPSYTRRPERNQKPRNKTLMQQRPTQKLTPRPIITPNPDA